MQTLNNVTITADTSQAVQAVQVLNNKWTEMNSAISVVGGALSKVGGFVGQLAQVGAKIDRVNQAAAGMSKYGLGKGMLQALRQDTADMVDQLTLAQESTRLLGSGAVQSMKDMGDAYKWAISVGQKVGIDAGEAVKKITNLLIGGEADALKQFGVQMELTGTKSEKTAKVLGMIRQEMKFSGEEFSLVAGDYAEKMQALRNSMLDAVEGFSLFGKGFNLVKDSVDFVAKKMKKSVGEIWGEISKSGGMGFQQLQTDVARIIDQLNTARTEGNEAAVQFLEQKLEKTIGEGQAFLVQFGDLYEKFGTRAGAADPTAQKKRIEDVLSLARSSVADTEAQVDAALEKVNDLTESQVRGMKNRAGEMQYEMALDAGRIEKLQKNVDMLEGKKSAEKLILDTVAAQDEIRARIVKKAADAAGLSQQVNLLQRGENDLLQMKDQFVSKRFSTLLKEVDAEKKIVEERRKYGKILDNGVAAEKSLKRLKDEYITVLDGQLKIATQLNDKAKMKYLLEAKDKAEAIKTLADLEKQISEQEVKDDKKKGEARIDQEKERLKYLKQRLALIKGDEYERDVAAELQDEIASLEILTKLQGDARKAEQARQQAIRDNSATIKRVTDEQKAASEKQAKENADLGAEDVKILETRIKRLRLVEVANTAAAKAEQARLDALREEDRLTGPSGTDTVERLEQLSKASEILGKKTAGLRQVGQDQIKAYQDLLDRFAAAALAGDQILAKSLEGRLIAMRRYATEEAVIREQGEEAKKKLAYAQYADEEIRQDIQSRELALQAALRDGSLSRAAALQNEIWELQKAAEANGRAAFAMQDLERRYSALAAVGSAATSAISKAAWADQEALQKYGGSRLKMVKDVFAEEMKTMAIKETVLSLSAAGRALLASVYAPPAAPALWASSASHAAAALATGVIGGALGVSETPVGTGGGGSGAAQQTGIGDVAPKTEEKVEIVVNVEMTGRDGWEGSMVDFLVSAQRKGKAKRGLA